MVPPVTRAENSSKAWKAFCQIWLPPLRNMSPKIRSPFVQMGKFVYSSINPGQRCNDTSKGAQCSTSHRACRATDEHGSGMSTEESQTNTLSPAPQPTSLAEAEHHNPSALPDQGCPECKQPRTGSRKWSCLHMP